MSEDQPTPLRILAVDFSHMWHQCYMALGGDALSEAFKRTLERVIRAREGYDRVALMLDDGPSFRKAVDVGYKAKREPQDEAFYEQRRRCVERLEKEGCIGFIPPEVMCHGDENGNEVHWYAEADDLCASLVAWCIAQGFPCDILTDDKDMMQLVDDEHAIRVVRPGNEKRSGPYDAARVEATFGAEKAGSWFGLSPARIVDWLALGGDKSDGYQAFPAWEDADGAHPGIGEGHAIALIRGFGSALGAIDALEAGNPLIKGAILAAMSRGLPTPRAAVERCILLATLRRDLPVDWTPLLAEPVYAPLVDPADAAPPPAQMASLAAPEVEGEPVPSVAMVRTEPSDAKIARFEARDLNELMWLAQQVYNSQLYKQFPTWEGAMLTMIEANERKVPMVTALRQAHVISGKVGWPAAFLVGLVRRSNDCEYFEAIEVEPTHCKVIWKRKGRPERSHVVTLENASAAGLLEKWTKEKKQIRTMLFRMATREGARIGFDEVMANIVTIEELGGTDPEDT